MRVRAYHYGIIGSGLGLSMQRFIECHFEIQCMLFLSATDNWKWGKVNTSMMEVRNCVMVIGQDSVFFLF